MNRNSIELASGGKSSGAPAVLGGDKPLSMTDLGKAVAENALLQAQLNQAFASRLLDLEKKVRDPHSLATESPRVEQVSESAGEDGNSQGPLNQAMAIRVLGLVKTDRQSQPSPPVVPAPEACPVKQEIPGHHAAAVEALSKAVGENALLQGQLNQVFAGRLLELQSNALLQAQLNQAIASRLLLSEHTAAQTQEALAQFLQTLEKLVHDLNRRVENLASDRASSGLVVPPALS